MHRSATTKTARLPGGLSLPYIDEGAPDAVPIMLLHGLSDSGHSFEPVIARWPRSVRAIAPCQRGHGNASAPESYQLADFAADVGALMDALSLQSAVLVGHSMSGAIALRFAIDHPDRVLGLVLVGTFAALRRNPDLVAFGETSILPLADPVDPVFVRAFQESTLARPVPEAMLDGIVLQSLKVPARVWRASWSMLLEADLTPDLPSVASPTLLVWGDQDEIALASEQEVLRRAIPRAHLEIFAGAGHAPHWEEPERFAKLVLDFVDECRGRAPVHDPSCPESRSREGVTLDGAEDSLNRRGPQ